MHLRFGDVARGGLRWSDRPEDFRTEILGLVKAQEVKNAVIVPVGAKGGFVVKRPPAPTGDPAADREAQLAEGVACYRTFIAAPARRHRQPGRGRASSPPERVVRHDADDPYLVVAADKGTATSPTSPTASPCDYGFWLGDAFASGGSVGYDHKAMGITARGAWESVKHHFRELGVDTQTQDFTCVGVGDMSGDVFGNGMLLSAAHPAGRRVRPPAHLRRSRTRTRRRPSSSARGCSSCPARRGPTTTPPLISAGGGVFPRTAKSMPITPQMRDGAGPRPTRSPR